MIWKLLIPLLAAAAAAAGPPMAEVQPVREALHGVEVIDPYRWLEGSAGLEPAGPDAALDARVAAWTDAQNAYGRSVLDRLPGRRELEARVRSMAGGGGRGGVVQRGDLIFYIEIEAGQQQPALRVAQAGGPRVVLDPAAVDPSGLTTLAWYEPSPDGRLVACGLFKAGDENATLYLVETATGTWLADEITGKIREVEWLPDGSGFLYNQLADLKNPSSRRVRFHRVGTHPRQDRTLIEQDKEGPGAKTWGPFAHLSPDGHWAVVGHWMGSAVNDLWAVDFQQWLRAGHVERRPIVAGRQAQSGLPDTYRKGDPIVGNTLYMTTSLDAPNKRVVAVDLSDPAPGRWREVIPERKDAALQNLFLARGLLVVEYLKNATTRLERFGLDGRPKGELPLPGLGTAALMATTPDRTEAFFDFSSFNTPPTLYRVDLATGERQVWWRKSVPFDPAAIEVEQIGYPSKDGTRISMFLVHRKGLKLDGCNPTLLYGYGGFGISTTPYFDGGMVPWLEAGGVYALPNLRGGGEYGEEWHRAGMLEKKQNVFDDFIAAAEWLIAKGYTRPEKLAALGGSNGGLLIGAVVTQRPELFAAGIALAPLMDMARYPRFLRARNWVSEYGSPDDPRDLATLLRYSPYHNVKNGVKYPALLVTAGERDERVHPLHARKMTARLQAATASDPATKPILLQVDRDTGHGMGLPADKETAAIVDQLSFLMWRTGGACKAKAVK